MLGAVEKVKLKCTRDFKSVHSPAFSVLGEHEPIRNHEFANVSAISFIFAAGEASPPQWLDGEAKLFQTSLKLQAQPESAASHAADT